MDSTRRVPAPRGFQDTVVFETATIRGLRAQKPPVRRPPDQIIQELAEAPVQAPKVTSCGVRELQRRRSADHHRARPASLAQTAEQANGLLPFAALPSVSDLGLGGMVLMAWRRDQRVSTRCCISHSFRRMAYCIVFSKIGFPLSSALNDTNSMNSPSLRIPNRSHRRRDATL